MTTGGADAAVTVPAHAKLNLSLRVLARETSGFHQLETLFCRLELADTLDVVRTGGPGVRLDVRWDAGGASYDTGPASANLAVRAATACLERLGSPHGIAIRLVKRIPPAAGLGGGSSDAAATLHAVNALHDDALDPDILLQIGARLGSDVPFFLARTPLALAWGRGGRILPVPPLPPRPVVLVVPGAAVNTAAAYADLADSRDTAWAAPAAVLRPPRSWDALADGAVNDFEAVVFAKLPLLAGVADALRRHGALLARLTGTGSVVFGVFPSDNAARLAAEGVATQFQGVRTILTRTCG